MIIMIVIFCACSICRRTVCSGRRWRCAASNVDHSGVNCWSASAQSTVSQTTSGRTRTPTTNRRPHRRTSPTAVRKTKTAIYRSIYDRIKFKKTLLLNSWLIEESRLITVFPLFAPLGCPSQQLSKLSRAIAQFYMTLLIRSENRPVIRLDTVSHAITILVDALWVCTGRVLRVIVIA